MTRILIANRGEIAVRIIRTIRELGMRSIAVYSDADREALHVDLADEAYRIGPAPSSESYLAVGKILEAARKSGATAIHPGYGFLSENATFARAVEESGFTFIGPTAEAIARLGDKSEARKTAESAGVPIVPGTLDAITIAEAPAEAARIGFPLIVKAAFGGGGRGMQVVRRQEDLEAALARAAREAQAYFGRPEVFLERYVERAHHVEAQVFADHHGAIAFLGERDCSVQRRHQKLIEETPSPVVDDALRTRIGEAAIALARAAGYRNAGTVEGIVDEDGEFAFLEMNTRLQVEHTVTEMVTGIDLVAAQIAAALGEHVDLRGVTPRGHAIQCRINAEDPGRNFLPGPGRVHRYREASGPFVRTDAGIVEGKEIAADYDSMFAKLIVAGETRERARARMLRALDEFEVEGVPTTIPLHRWILGTEEFVAGTHTTTWLEQALKGASLTTGTVEGPLVAPSAKATLPAEMVVEVGGRRVPVRLFDQRRSAPPAPLLRHAAHHGTGVHSVIAAPMQGTIVRVLVEPGQEIEAGDVVCILEAMKMENAIPAPREGTVSELPIEAGQVVQVGQTLAVID